MIKLSKAALTFQMIIRR